MSPAVFHTFTNAPLREPVISTLKPKPPVEHPRRPETEPRSERFSIDDTTARPVKKVEKPAPDAKTDTPAKAASKPDTAKPDEKTSAPSASATTAPEQGDTPTASGDGSVDTTAQNVSEEKKSADDTSAALLAELLDAEKSSSEDSTAKATDAKTDTADFGLGAANPGTKDVQAASGPVLNPLAAAISGPTDQKSNTASAGDAAEGKAIQSLALAQGASRPQPIKLGTRPTTGKDGQTAALQVEGEAHPADKAQALENEFAQSVTQAASKTPHDVSASKSASLPSVTAQSFQDSLLPGLDQTTAQTGLHSLQATTAQDSAAKDTIKAATPSPTLVASTPIGAVPIEIGMKVLAGMTQFEIRLDPAELGRIDVKLDFNGDGTVKTHLLVDRVETLALLQRDARTLERAFEQAGLKSSAGGLELSLRDQPQRDGRGDGSQYRDTAPQGATQTGSMPESSFADASSSYRRPWRGVSGIDVMI